MRQAQPDSGGMYDNQPLEYALSLFVPAINPPWHVSQTQDATRAASSEALLKDLR